MDNPAYKKSPPPPPKKLFRSVTVNSKTENIPLQRQRSSPLFRERGVSLDEETSSYASIEEDASAAADELTVQICFDTIKMDLMEHMKASSGRIQLLQDIEVQKINHLNLVESFGDASKLEINVAFLWAAFMKRSILLEGLVGLGAELRYFEPNQGLSALHLAAFSGCILSTQYLIAQGCDVNEIFKCFTPLHCAAFGDSPETAKILLKHNARVQDVGNCPNNCHESVLHCAVRANAIACVRLFSVEGAQVIQMEHSGMSPVHLAADLGHAQCLKIMLETKGVDVDAQAKEQQTALHLAAESGYVDCVDILLDFAAEVNAKNCRGQTALHLAARAQAYDCVELLLRKGNANPNAADVDKRTPLHAAICRPARSVEVIETLIAFGADVSAKDQYLYTPLHIAALNELSQCVDLLIYNGADVTARCKSGMTAVGLIARKTPGSMAMITYKLDLALTLHNHSEPSSREEELQLDFRSILQHCHPREISFLNTFVDEGQKEILLHPLCAAFLYLKWEKIRKYYIARMLFCFIFVLSLSIYVLTALSRNCYMYHVLNETAKANISKLDGNETEHHMYDMLNKTEKANISKLAGNETEPHPCTWILANDRTSIEILWYILVIITCFEILRKVYGVAGYPSIKQYLAHPENIFEWVVILGVFLISCVYWGETYPWQNRVAAFVVLVAWSNLMLMVGQLPIFESYIAMYMKVQREFIKLFLAYFCFLIGYTIAFCVIFPGAKEFSNPIIAFATVLTMMTGELQLDLLIKNNGPQTSKEFFANQDVKEEDPLYYQLFAELLYVSFLLGIAVILMNLLVGIAVHDIQGLQKTAGLSKLVRQTKLISNMESALFVGYLPKQVLNLLQWSALVSPKAYRVVLYVRPLNPRENRLPKDIMKAAYEIAKQRKKVVNNSTAFGNYNTYVKRLVNNNIETNSDIVELNILPAIQSKLDKHSECIKNLTKFEVKNLKELTELRQAVAENHRLIKELIDVVVKQKTSDNLES